MIRERRASRVLSSLLTKSLPTVAASLLIAAVFLLLRWKPTSWFTQAAAVFVVAYGLLGIYRPAAFFRRTAAVFASLAGAGAILPALSVDLRWSDATFSLLLDASPWIVAVCGLCSLGFGVLEL
jgi:hypothetical protein